MNLVQFKASLKTLKSRIEQAAQKNPAAYEDLKEKYASWEKKYLEYSAMEENVKNKDKDYENDAKKMTTKAEKIISRLTPEQNASDVISPPSSPRSSSPAKVLELKIIPTAEKVSAEQFVFSSIYDFGDLFNTNLKTAEELVCKLIAPENISKGVRILAKVPQKNVASVVNILTRTSDVELLNVIEQLFKLEATETFCETENLLLQLIKKTYRCENFKPFNQLIKNSLQEFDRPATLASIDQRDSLMIAKKTSSHGNSALFQRTNSSSSQQNHFTQFQPLALTPGRTRDTFLGTPVTQQPQPNNAFTWGSFPTAMKPETSQQSNANTNAVSQQNSFADSHAKFRTMVDNIFSPQNMPELVLRILKSAQTYLGDKKAAAIEDKIFMLLSKIIRSIVFQLSQRPEAKNSLLMIMTSTIPELIAPQNQPDQFDELRKEVVVIKDIPQIREELRKRIRLALKSNNNLVTTSSSHSNQDTLMSDDEIVKTLNGLLIKIQAPTKTNNAPENTLKTSSNNDAASPTQAPANTNNVPADTPKATQNTEFRSTLNRKLSSSPPIVVHDSQQKSEGSNKPANRNRSQSMLGKSNKLTSSLPPTFMGNPSKGNLAATKKIAEKIAGKARSNSVTSVDNHSPNGHLPSNSH